jgi:hypothetical protein
MPTRLNQDAYQRLVDEDLAWLREQPRTLEREHVELIVRDSVRLYYPVGPGNEVAAARAARERGPSGLLLPCPFCGSWRQSMEQDRFGLFALTCCGCGAHGPAATVAREASAAWDRRGGLS